MPLPSSLLANQSIVIDSSCLIRESSSILYLGIAKEIYHIDVLAGSSHGLGLGLWFSHVVELWLWCLQGPSLFLG